MHYTSHDVYEEISKQNNDPIVERKTCTVSWAEFAIYQSDLDFYKKISPTFAWTTFDIPTPTLCPEERQRKRLAWRNERTLYRRTCDATGKKIISVYEPTWMYKVFERDIRFWDSRNGDEYAQEIDRESPFFPQLDTLIKAVPHINLFVTQQENSAYTNGAANVKNCYLCFNCDYMEDCLYTSSATFNKNCIDCLMAYHSQHCYASVNIHTCFDCLRAINCSSCTNCLYIAESTWCTDSFLCTWLVQKKYYILNKKYSKEQYEEKKKELLSTYSQEELREKFMELWNKTPRPQRYGNKNENCIWNYINESNNCVSCYESNELDSCKYCYYMHTSSNCMDFDVYGDHSERLYECTMTWGQCSNNSFCRSTRNNSNNNLYSWLLLNCSNCFWCFSLKNKNYCIFNKQYTKETYESTVARLISHMQSTNERWENLPSTLCPFPYNKTFAGDFFPLNKESVEVMWYTWQEKEYPIQLPTKSKKVSAENLPDISDIDESILHKILLCQETKKPYRIIKNELSYYRKKWIQLPKLHPDVRHIHRLSLRMEMNIYIRPQENTSDTMLTVHPPGKWYEVLTQEAYTDTTFG